MTAPVPLGISEHPLALQQVEVRELVSGVDALYLSGRTELSEALYAVLEERRQAAETAEDPQPLLLGGEEFFVAPRSFGKYRYRLEHPSGLFGITESDRLPSLYVQPASCSNSRLSSQRTRLRDRGYCDQRNLSVGGYDERMAEKREVEFVFEPQPEGGFYVYAPDLPGLHTQGDDLDQATDNAREALELYVEGLHDDGEPLPDAVIRRTLPIPA